MRLTDFYYVDRIMTIRLIYFRLKVGDFVSGESDQSKKMPPDDDIWESSQRIVWPCHSGRQLSTLVFYLTCEPGFWRKFLNKKEIKRSK